MRALVTGATGLIGGRLVAALAEEVVIFGGDVRDGAAIAQAAAGCDVIHHLAGRTTAGDAADGPATAFAVNVMGTAAVLEAARAHGCRVVVAGSDRVYGPGAGPCDEDAPLRPTDAYAGSKACADLLARSWHASFGVPVAVLRLAGIYGPGDRHASRLVPGLVAAARAGRAPVLRSDGTPRRDLLHVDDAVAAFVAADALLAEGGPSGPWNVGSGTTVAVGEVAALAGELAGVEAAPVLGGGAEPATHTGDPARFAARTGWRATVALRDGLAGLLR